MNPITSLFPEGITHAIGWTLFHSLWQGAFVALLLALLLVLLHRQSARVRYAAAGGAMLLQLLLAGGTFAFYYSQSQTQALQASILSESPAIPAAGPAALDALPQDSFWASPLEGAQLYFERHMPLLVMLWLLGMVMMALRFVGGVAYTQRLRHYRTAPLTDYWQQRLSALCQAAGMQRAVRLAESALVQVPMAIGIAKPVILLPVGAVTGLSQAQVEAVLAHELAHILRKDYLVNLLQSVVDMLFFYHPAMWWVSGVVRAERENCCDDIAVALCGDTLTYARALAELETMRLPAGPALAVAFSGKRGTLLSRIKRLVGQPSLKPTFTEGFAAALVLVMGLLVLSFGAMAGLRPQQEQDAAAEIQQTLTFLENTAEAADEPELASAYTVQDSTGKPRDIVIIKNKKGKVTKLYVDGKRIPKKHIAAYEDLVNQRLEAVQRAPRATRAEVEMEMKAARAAVADARRNYRENYVFNFNFDEGDSLASMAPFPPMPPMPPMPAMPPMPPFPAIAPPVPPVAPVPPLGNDKKALKDYKQDMEEYEAEMNEFEQEMQGFEEEMREYEIEIKQHTQELRKSGALQGARQREQVERQVERSHEMVRHQQEMAQHQQEMAMQHARMAQEHEKQFQKVKEELIKDGIIQKGDEQLDIRINNGEMYVNDKKQPKKAYEKYKKLMKIAGDGSANFNFRYNNN
ncbi:M48 family metalloprotease [Pontibacter sp. E15-1]|uniref:M56 family metallopeptidase n=1 Tax=Pontibacter sp. E15-1 TaxID=2919918 RepID=UPI001F5018D3|nr:M56 family metallopeptidase [Pontibacter sp. E15-1]MCJ8165423.1 M48 family metalloprotease [Pontibacter sp. E15-1]